MRPEVLRSQLEDIITTIGISVRTNDRELYKYYRKLYSSSLSYLKRHGVRLTDEQAKKLEEADQKYGVKT